MIIKKSRHTYSETVASLSQTIRAAGNRIFASIDQSAAAAGVGLKLRPTTLIVFGNPKGGTGLMDRFPLIGLDLPLKLLVWEEDGEVNVAFVPMKEIASRYEATGLDEPIAAMDHALDTLTNTIA
jgi:uncharacterized protein (DUF302 family)